MGRPARGAPNNSSTLLAKWKRRTVSRVSPTCRVIVLIHKPSFLRVVTASKRFSFPRLRLRLRLRRWVGNDDTDRLIATFLRSRKGSQRTDTIEAARDPFADLFAEVTWPATGGRRLRMIIPNDV